MINLNDDFSFFKNSSKSKKPAFDVKSDWREQQYEAAKINGDLAADKNPDTSLTEGYVEAPEKDDGNYEYKENGLSRDSW